MELSTATLSPLDEVDVDDIIDSYNNPAAAADVTVPAKKQEGTASWETALFSFVAYMYTLLSLTSWWFFLVQNQFFPHAVATTKLYSIDTASVVPSIWTAAWKNMCVLFAFSFAHSLLARKSVKQWMGLPTAAERPFFCMQAAFLLHMVQMTFVEADAAPIWDLTESSLATTLVLIIYWLGTAFTLTSTFDFFSLIDS